jgi:hypothetical protein
MEIFVRRPALALVISIVILLVGIFAARSIPILQFPKIESSSLQVTTSYFGASPEVVQGFITEPIDTELRTRQEPSVQRVPLNASEPMSTKGLAAGFLNRLCAEGAATPSIRGRESLATTWGSMTSDAKRLAVSRSVINQSFGRRQDSARHRAWSSAQQAG